MRRKWITALLLGTTALITAVLLMGDNGDRAAEARLVQVEMGDIRNIAALTGRVSFDEERLAYTQAAGLVSDVYVSPGERVLQGQALLRLDASALEQAAAAWIAGGERLPEEFQSAVDARQLLETTVVRAPETATVRQVLTQESAAVAAGTPVVLLSSTRRLIQCAAAEADARSIRPGMEALISLEGEARCRAEVTEIGEPEADPLTGRMTCRVTLLPEKHMDLPAGTAVEADVLLSGRENVPVLPVEAITPRDTVWWVHDGRCTEIPAEIILSDEMYAWVSLPEGMQVAVGEFRDGQRIAEVRR